MPLGFRCPGAVRVPKLRVSEVSEPADLGSAGHEALRPLVELGGVQWEQLPAIAARWAVDLDDLRIICATGTKLWQTVAPSFPEALTELPYEVEIAPGVVLTGHVDILSVTGHVARAADWKTGRKDSDYRQQMRAYGAMVLLGEPELTECTATILWTREGDIENYTMTRAEADAWLLDVRDTVLEWDGVFRPGAHCQHCPRSHECGAANALARRDVAAILDVDIAAGLAEMEPAQIVELYRKASAVAKYAERTRDAIKAHVVATGDIQGADGRLTIETEDRRGLDTLAAWPVLEAQGFTDVDFAACVDVRISHVERRVAERAGRGKGAGAVRTLAQQLTAAGAIRTKQTKKLVEKR